MYTALYLRVSTMEQADKNFSLAAQESKLRAYAEAKTLSNIKVFTDPGYSGSNMNRPALTQLLESVKRNQVSNILVYKLDRLSRSQKDTLNIIEDYLLPHDTNLISLSESFDTSTSFGRAMIGILSVFAQLERENFKERSRMGMIQRAKEGRISGYGGKVFGYDYINGELIINDYEAMIVRKIYDYYVKGLGVTKIFMQLQKEHPNVIKSSHHVWQILRRRTYTGDFDYMDESYEGIHEAIIDKSIYDRVQVLRESRSGKQKSDVVYMLTGLTYCKCCGYKMQGTVSSSTYKDKRYERRYYKCNTNKRNKVNHNPFRCNTKSIKKDELEHAVILQIKALDIDLKIDDIQTNTIDDKAIDKRLNELEKQSEKLLNLYIEDSISKSILDKKLEEINTEKEALQNTEIEDNQSKLQALELAKEFNFDDAMDYELQNLIHLLIKRIDVDNSSVDIQFIF